jgi:hypothetical protein
LSIEQERLELARRIAKLAKRVKEGEKWALEELKIEIGRLKESMEVAS